ncbi:MAG: flavodoxin family protein [Limimaricola sp.]|uniref:NAD(P)H-dependent oxidoreductase n=1 Tax=Limimaricola sp. TaxID=2211665 RepID=UPI001DAA0781|nr:NAD(P)H-dependent oxidoreductase [Limimaricola sp.]MBI1418157.1 flavodoxin family protein [Limimaricola sp.]
MGRVMVIFAHPVPESFSAVLHSTVVERLQAKGWEVDDCDLYAEGFSPVLTTEERRNYHDTAINCAPVQVYVDRLRAAQALVLVFPVWNYGYPAILKGFFDRVFLPGVSFDLADGKLTPALLNIRKLAAVTTYGGTRWRTFLAGDAPRKVVTRAVWGVTRASTTRYLALHDMNNATEAQRRAFLARVGQEMDRF